MAAGALAASRASVAVAITGIAGPGGGSAEKPVGLVHFGLGQWDGETRHLERRYGDLGRSGIRRVAVADHGCIYGEIGWVLEDNKGMVAIADAVRGTVNSEYRIYEKPLT